MAAPKKKKSPQEAGKTARVVAMIERLLKNNELQNGSVKVSDADLAELEAELGRPLPPTYVAIMKRFGQIGRRVNEWNGWSHDHRNIYGPVAAWGVTRKLREEFGKEGRHAALVNRTFFCSHWPFMLEVFGVDDEGKVRVLHIGRPGTMLRVAAETFEEHLLKQLGEISAVETGDGTEIDPSTLTDLEVMEEEDLRALGRLNKMKKLERLTLWGVDEPAWLRPLGKHPSLREIHLYGGDAKTLPDELFLAPRLEKIDFRRTDAAKTYGAGLSGVLAWFHEAEIPPKKRAVFVRLLADDASTATEDDLLAALDAPNDRINDNALRALGSRLPGPKSFAKARIAIVGRPHTKGIIGQLEKAGAVIEKKIENATHVLVGVHPQRAWEKRAKGVPLIHEQALSKRPASGGSADGAKVRALLRTMEPKKIEQAIAMMQTSGAPNAPGVLEAMLLITQHPKMPPKSRKELERLASEVFPSFTRVVRDVLGGTNLYNCGATKLSDRLGALEKKSGGAFSASRLCLDLMATKNDNFEGPSPALLYAFESGDEKLAASAIELARQKNKLDLGGLEARIGAAVDKTPGAIAKVKGIDELSFRWTYLREVPKAVAKLTGLRVLDLEENDLKTLPGALSSLKKLEELALTCNRMSEIPKVVFELTSLKKLAIAHEEGSPKPRLRSIPDDIGKLKNLVDIDLSGAKLKTLPDALLDLPKLKSIRLDDAQIDDLPKSALKVKDPKKLRKLRLVKAE